MSLILSTSDFTGKYKIGQDNFSDLQSWLDEYEKNYAVQLLGAELYDLFEADYNAAPPGQPTAQRFKDIFDPFQKDEEGCLHISLGMKTMLKGFVYFEYQRNGSTFITPSGTTKTEHANDTPASFQEAGIWERYNRSIETLQQIQWFICENADVYPEYNGQHLGISFGF